MRDTQTIRAVHITGPDRLEIVEKPLPSTKPGMTLVEPAYVGLCGTDRDLFAGTMIYFAQGTAHYPLQPGHEWSGALLGGDDDSETSTRVIMDPIVGCNHCEICAGGQVVRCQDRLEIGVRNGMDGALATAIAAPLANLIPVPDAVSLRDAALVEPMVTSLEGIRRADPQVGEEALVVGAGTLGLMGAMILSARGLRTHVLLRDPTRVPTVEAAGGVPWLVGQKPAVEGFDVVIEAAGSADGIQASLDNVASGGRVALLGLPSTTVEIDVARLVVNDIITYGVLNGPGQFQTGLDAIASGVVRPDVIIDRVYPFEEIEAALARSRERDRARPKVLVQMDAGVGVAVDR